MRYRGFEIDCNVSSDKEMIYSMSVYDGADDLRKHCLYELYDIDTDGDINEKVMSIVDDNPERDSVIKYRLDIKV